MSTITSIVTAMGEAAVSIIKISGPESFAIAEKLTAKTLEHHQIELAWIKDDSKKLDQVIVLPFRAPNSYTGEDLIEIQSHGGIWITQKILDLVLNQGAKLAKPGEFSERAFINHKLDLSQAEAILDIVKARSSLSGENAIKLYQGILGSSIKNIREKLLNLLGEITASIDFPDEVGDYDREKFKSIIKNTILEVEALLEGEDEGHILRNGYKVAIIGNPNAGKSTLLNTLLKKERAIVTDIPGTTRDLIEESFSLKGLPIILLDTAGIRESSDKVEKIGIERSQKAIEEADLVLYLDDMSSDESSCLLDLIQDKNHIKIGTKLDLVKEANKNTDINISALENTNISELKDMLFTKILKQSSSSDQVKVNHRQADLLRKAKDSLNKSLESCHLAEDFWTIDLKTAIHSLGEITGESLTEELLDNIFRRFCIGK